MKPSYIYFDLDNTLLDHTSAESKAQQATYEQYSELQKVELDIWLSKYKEVNHNLWNQYQKGLVDRHQLQFSRFNDTMLQLELSASRSKEIGNSYMQNYQKYWCWVDGVEESFSKISDRFEVGLITNGFKETQLKKYKHLSLDRYSDVMIVSEDIGKMKPHPMVFDHATEVAGVPREEILYVGDSYSSDVVGGKNAGWKTAWYTALITKNGEEDIADFEFEDFDELLAILDL